MHSALFVADLPQDGTGTTFLQGLSQKQKQIAHAERLADNVWMVPFAKHPETLAWLIATADRNGVPYKLLAFADEPQWLKGSSGPA